MTARNGDMPTTPCKVSINRNVGRLHIVLPSAKKASLGLRRMGDFLRKSGWSLVNKEQEMKESNWYEKSELPPANTECEVRIEGQWLPTVVVGHYANEAVVVDPCVTTQRFFCTTANNLRPLQSETDKLVEQAMTLFSKTEATTDAKEGIEYAVRKLIEQGYRKIKQQSEEEFAIEVTSLLSKYNTDWQGVLYRAGCRFLDKGDTDA